MALTDYQQQVTAALAECGDAVGDGALEAVKTWIKDDDDHTRCGNNSSVFQGTVVTSCGAESTGSLTR